VGRIGASGLVRQAKDVGEPDAESRVVLQFGLDRAAPDALDFAIQVMKPGRDVGHCSLTRQTKRETRDVTTAGVGHVPSDRPVQM